MDGNTPVYACAHTHVHTLQVANTVTGMAANPGVHKYV